MTDIRTRIRVAPDHRISGIAPSAVPPGDHEVTISIAQPGRPQKRTRIADLPTHDIPWDGSISLRPEDTYTDDSR